MSDGEVQLLQRAVAGDEAALASLLEAHGPIVRQRIAASIGAQWRSTLDVDDVMQVTYLEAFLQVGRLSTETVAGFVSWLRHVADNNLRDAIRALEADKRPNPRRRVHAAPGTPGESSLFALVEMLGVTTATPSRHAAREEAAAFLERALAELPPDYETVVRMYDLDQRPIDEVAAALGRSPGAVYMLRARAHDALRGILGGPSQFFSQAP